MNSYCLILRLLVSTWDWFKEKKNTLITIPYPKERKEEEKEKTHAHTHVKKGKRKNIKKMIKRAQTSRDNNVC